MRGVDFSPVFYNGKDVVCGHIGEGEVVFRREGYDVALAGCAFCAE